MFDFFGIKKKTRKIKIQVTDDEPNIVQTLKDRLEMNDFDVVVAHNGSDGLKIAEQEKPDVILLDVIMPVMNGLEALEQIRTEEAVTGKHTPIIALTADALKGTEEKLIKAGFDGYLTKPVKIRDLANELVRLTAGN